MSDQGDVIAHLRDLLKQCPPNMRVSTGKVLRGRATLVVDFDTQQSAPTIVFDFITKLVQAAPVVLAEWRERSPYDTFPDIKPGEVLTTEQMMRLDSPEGLEHMMNALAERKESCPRHGEWTLTAEACSCPICDWPGHDLFAQKCCKPGTGCNDAPPLDTSKPAVLPDDRDNWLCFVCDGGPLNHGTCGCPDGPVKEYHDPDKKG